ncbi:MULTISPECIES: tyrosine-type recombinase/integrase [unclassified Sphingomonas]|uniref:tyrosine-type recombinase/integrase n=1 Tax=unclassified Sphingomonas TaxID=196159 RepID=UPI00226AEE38|nr:MULTISPECIES: tyrosine-type recombinase/integrase [unclassified Sphingomonas]
MTGKILYVTPFVDRHGKRRWRFRRKGYPHHSFKSPHGTKAFEREYAACLNADPEPVVLRAAIPGSVGDVIARYYSDNAFLDLKPATQTVYRGVLERFRTDFAHVSIKAFDADRIQRLMTAMRHKPHAAARLRKLLAQLLRVARRGKLVPAGFDPISDTRPPKTSGGGYHRWTEEELTAFENHYPLGTKPRLAFDLLLYGAQRSGDVRLMTHEMIADGRIRLDQRKTSNAVDIPVVELLQASLDAGPLGKTTLLETKDGDPFTEKGFYGMMKKACRAAGVPHCSPHGLRKAAARRCREAGCTDEEGMAITGHKTVKEYRHYAGSDARPEVADAAMKKVMANRSDRLAGGTNQLTGKTAE